MNFTFDTRILLLICCLLQGLAGLRLVKFSIPAYKLRGESAFLECQYEMNGPHGVVTKQTRNRHNQRGGAGGGIGAGNGGHDFNYIDTDSAGDEIPTYRRMRTYPHQTAQQAQNQQFHHPYAAALRSDGGYYQQQNYEEQHQMQPQTPQSPYGHSIYRGRSPTSSSSSSSSLSALAGISAATYNGRVGASTYVAGSHLTAAERDDSFGDSAERDDDFDENDDDEENEDDDEHDQTKGETLYAIKWYKDNEEFYRYVPKAKPPKTSYRVDGVRVIEEHSDSSRVLLRGLTLNSTGVYRCEVSAEAPNFSSVQGEGRMDIVYLPRDGPHIKGQQFQYQIGETLNLNCTSGKSHPASQLQWFINELAVVDGRYLMQYNGTVHRHGLITSTLGLQLTVDARHFHNGAMRVKCLASISPVLWKGGKESVLQRRPGIIDNREAMLLVHSSAVSRLWQCNFLSSLRLLSTAAILTRICQLLLRTAFT